MENMDKSAEMAAEMALLILQYVEIYNKGAGNFKIAVQIGIHSGEVIAGVTGMEIL